MLRWASSPALAAGLIVLLVCWTPMRGVDAAERAWDSTLARGATREVDFITSEGTWMSMDIAPDGRDIVFDLLGHIYRVSALGGQAECLTQDSGVALNFHPRYSPDGRTIAFVSDRAGQESLWVMQADGGGARAVFLDDNSLISSPAWSPDGRFIYAVREFPTYSMHRRSARIWRFPIADATAEPQEIVGQKSGVQAYWPSVAPDGRTVYFFESSFARVFDGLQERGGRFGKNEQRPA